MRILKLALLTPLLIPSAVNAQTAEDNLRYLCVTYADVLSVRYDKVSEMRIGNEFYSNLKNLESNKAIGNAANVEFQQSEFAKDFYINFSCPTIPDGTSTWDQCNPSGEGGETRESRLRFGGFYSREEVLRQVQEACPVGGSYSGVPCIYQGAVIREDRQIFEIVGNVKAYCSIENDRDGDFVPNDIDQCDGVIGPYEKNDVYDEFFSDESKRGCTRVTSCSINEEEVDGICRPKCKIYETRHALTGQCVDKICPVGKTLNRTTGSCDQIFCPVGTKLVGSSCVPITCRSGEILVGSQCIADPNQCPHGQELNAAGKCEIVCPDLTKLNDSRTECVCTLEDVKEPEDLQAKAIENEVRAKRSGVLQPLGPIFDPITTDMLSGQKCLINQLRLINAKPKITSVYRPPSYQEHFADIMDRYDELVAAKKQFGKVPSQCMAIEANILKEKNEIHNIKEAGRKTSNHIKSRAFDLSWDDNQILFNKTTIDSIASSCGLCRPFPDPKDYKPGMRIYKPDAVHFEPKSLHRKFNPAVPKSFGFCGGY